MAASVQSLPVQPELVELSGGPEFFISGTVTQRDGDVIHIICYVERRCGDRIEWHEVLRCHMGAAQYQRNLMGAYHHLRMFSGSH